MVKKIIAISLLLFLSACDKPLNRNTFMVCGTYLNVTSRDKRAAKIVYDEFKRLESIFNAFDSSSELARLNDSFNVPVSVSLDLINILELSQQVYSLTSGAFDVSHGALYSFWKDFMGDKPVSQLPSNDVIGGLMALGGMDNIIVNKQASTVTIKKKGLHIDLGGIADGYMVDSAVGKLRDAGISSALIDVGGDIYCLGTNAGKPWVVGVRNPDSAVTDIVGQELLVDEAVTTSGNYEQFFDFNGKRYSHIIDPRTGYPADNLVSSVTVITKNCLSADALATAFYVLGEKGTEYFLAVNPSTMRIFMVLEENKRRIRVFK